VPALSASAVPASQPSGAFFGLGRVATAATQDVPLEAPIGVTLVLLAVGLALAGGLIAGGVGAFRAARLRPADALRDLG
jgi:ABC-type antimicrobial peptide transport system permease subunit